MYIKDIMPASVITAHPSVRASEVAELLADTGTNSIFVVEGDDLLGMITQAELLRHVFPTYQEFYNDLVHNIDFDELEQRARELTFMSAAEIMRPVDTTVSGDMPIMKVAAWMLLRDIGCVPVVDDDGRFQGAVSRGDIFAHTVQRRLRDDAKVAV